MSISVAKLQQLVTVAQCGSFSKAAAELNVSQPALSRSVAAMEDRYGFQIFNRVGHGVQLTAAGTQVISQAEPLLQSLRVFDNNLRLFGSAKAGRLSLGLAPLLASQQLAQFTGEFFNDDTKVELQVLIRSGAILLDSLKNDLIELCFFPETYIDPVPEIDIETVGTITPVCVVRAGHPLLSKITLHVNDLAEFPWASSVDPPAVMQTLRPARFVCDNYHILREAVLASDLICICSAAFVAQQLKDGSLREIQVAGLSLPATTIYMAKLCGRINSPLAEVAVKRMRQHLS
jgi:DNA-binding transcriptional LysR family regulator